MFGFMVAVHVFFCVVLVFIVLLQGGKGAELGAAFGSVGQANSSRTEMTPIGKITTLAAIVFMLSSLTLAYLSSKKVSDSLMSAPAVQSAPVNPCAPTTDTATKLEENKTEAPKSQ